MRNNSDSEKAVYAGFWVRAAAYLIDCALVYAGLLFIRLVKAASALFYTGTLFDRQILFQYTLTDVVFYIVTVLYFIICTYGTGATLGKRAMNLRVIRASGNIRLSFWNIVYRETVGRFLSGFVLGIGYMLAGIDSEKRGLHDRLCETRVIYAKTVKIFTVSTPGKQLPPIYRMPDIGERNKEYETPGF